MNLLKKNLKRLLCLYFSKIYALLFFAVILSAQNVFSQQFTVAAAPTHETCPGNGMLMLSTENAVPAIPVNYKVYLLPNTTTPLFNSSGTSVIGLNNGNYLVVATQIINGTPVQDSIEVAVEDVTIPLTFDLDHVNALCGADGSITITVTSGTVVSYETISGPIIKAPQASNVLGNLAAGTYAVRVTDNCGTALVVTHNVPSDAATLNISTPIFPDSELPACDLITAAHDISATQQGLEPQVPLTVIYTVHPPGGGAPVVYTQTVTATGDGPDVHQIIPFYYDTPYYYDLQVTDACGIVYNVNNNMVDQHFTVVGNIGDAGCPGKFLKLSLSKFVAPYTITFTQSPDGFDPAALNPGHPGPFTASETSYGNEDGVAIPYGIYSFSVTDACGHTCVVNNLEAEEQEVNPAVSTFPANCFNSLGGVEINITGFEMVAAFITVAPPEYPDALEDDVTEYITPEFKLEMLQMLPPGNYVARVIDECGREYTEPFTINVASFASIGGNVRVDCTTGFGSARISSSTPINKVIITQAPAAFTATVTLPHNANYNISSSGKWYMNNMPPGTYKFLVDDDCTTNFELTKIISGYNTTKDELEVTRNCGSFNILLTHTSTSSIFQFFGLQKEYGPGIWGHPATGVLQSGPEPDEENAYEITSGNTVNSLNYTGNFRIVKCYSTYGTGREDDTVPNEPVCFEVLHEFEFYDDLQFDYIQNLTCSGDIADVQVFFIGAEPITYQITEKNGQPFIVDNGTDNIFEALEPAQYTITAEDPCGNRAPITFSVADLPSLVAATSPGDLSACDQGSDNMETFDLSAQTPLILDGQNPINCIVTYHTSQADADTGANALPLSYSTSTTTIYARVLNNLNTACHAVTTFDITVMPAPQLQMPDNYSICEGESVTVYGDLGFTSYKWDGVAGGAFKTYSSAGTHVLTVTDQNGCSSSKSFTVASSSAPSIATIDIADWNDINNTITVITEDTPSSQYFEYSLDGINYQPGNVFTGLAPGPYTVYVRDIFDCGADEGEVYLLTYPKFFTPNGDGINDLWRIKFSDREPEMLIYIYDRYGKIVSSFDAMSTGWDGTYNGRRLPATDYWFLVKRQDGKEYKGHFSMLR